MVASEEFTAALKALIRERGESQTSVARMLGVSASYLSKLTNGQRAVTADLVEQLDAFLDGGGRLLALIPPSPSDPRVPQQLPAPVADFIEPTGFLHQLEQSLSTSMSPTAAATIVIEGRPGMGKSATQIHFAHHIAWRFADGILYEDLREAEARTAEVLERFLRALGVQVDQDLDVEARSALLRTATAGRQLLVVLDNAARDDDVLPLMPGGGATLVSARRRLPKLAARTGAHHLVLPPLSAAASRTLLGRLVGPARVGAEPVAADRIIGHAGGSPAALRAVGDHLAVRPVQPLHAFAAEFSNTGILRIAGSQRAGLDEVYASLMPDAAMALRIMGKQPCEGLDERALLSLVGRRIAISQHAVAELRAHHLLTDTESGLHLDEPVRSYAVEKAEADDSGVLDAAVAELVRWYLDAAVAANDALAPGWEGGVLDHRAAVPGFVEALTWCASAVEPVLKLAAWARCSGFPDLAWELTLAFMPYFYVTKCWELWLHMASIGVSAARMAGNRLGIGRCLHNLGWAQLELHRAEEARRNFREALELQDDLGDRRGRAWTLLGLGVAAGERDDFTETAESLTQSAGLFIETGLPFGAAVARSLHARALTRRGNLDHAQRLLCDALGLAVEADVSPAEGLVRHMLGDHYLARREYKLALVQLDRALGVRRSTRQRWAEGEVQLSRADAFAALGDLEQACTSLKKAIEIFSTLHDPRALEARGRLAALCSGGVGKLTEVAERKKEAAAGRI